MSASTNWEDAYRTQTERVEELRRENAALRNEVARLNNQTNWVCSCGGTDCAGQKENATLRKQLEQWEQSTKWFAEWADKKQELERENAALAEENRRLHVELDAHHNGEQLRVLRAENAALRAELLEEARVNGMGSEREAKLLAEVAALRLEKDSLKSALEALVLASMNRSDEP